MRTATCSKSPTLLEVGVSGLQREKPDMEKIEVDPILGKAKQVLVNYYTMKHGMTPEAAEELFDDVVRFLDLGNVMNCVPSQAIDEGWHEFVLHTRLYADFCRARYGRFVHHNPSDGTKSEEHYRKHFIATLQAAEKAYGVLSANWQGRSATCDCYSCQSCDNDCA